MHVIFVLKGKGKASTFTITCASSIIMTDKLEVEGVLILPLSLHQFKWCND